MRGVQTKSVDYNNNKNMRYPARGEVSFASVIGRGRGAGAGRLLHQFAYNPTENSVGLDRNADDSEGRRRRTEKTENGSCATRAGAICMISSPTFFPPASVCPRTRYWILTVRTPIGVNSSKYPGYPLLQTHERARVGPLCNRRGQCCPAFANWPNVADLFQRVPYFKNMNESFGKANAKNTSLPYLDLVLGIIVIDDWPVIMYEYIVIYSFISFNIPRKRTFSRR